MSTANVTKQGMHPATRAVENQIRTTNQSNTTGVRSKASPAIQAMATPHVPTINPSDIPTETVLQK